MQIPEMLNNTTDCILVGYDFTNGKDKTVLVVGRKTEGVAVEIINAFQGKEAEALYQRLITKKEKETDRPDTHSKIWTAYHRLVNALHDENSTKDDLGIAMEEAIGYLGEVLDD